VLAETRGAEPYLDPVQLQEASNELAAPLERPVVEGEDPYAIQRDLQEVMQRLVGIFRVEADLEEAIRQLGDLRRRWRKVRATGGRAYNPGWNLVFELGNLLTISEAVTRSALQRVESRGAHSRLDYPASDDTTWNGLNSVVVQGPDGTMSVKVSPLPTMSDELRTLLGGEH
jgi:succinate dehydrogenase / fumarate reductase flavoprotein subunit